MAVVYRCDKCHREAKDPSSIFALKVPKEVVANDFDETELCRNCLRRLNDWLRPDAMEAPRRDVA